MNRKYWMIGTKTSAYFSTYMNFISNKNLEIGNQIFIVEDENNSKKMLIRNIHNDNIYEFNSKSTGRQYLIVWISLGFLKDTSSKNTYIINTELNSKESLFDLAKIYILLESKNSNVNDYRFTIIINSLFTAGEIKLSDRNLGSVKQVKGNLLTFSTISKLNGEFEIYLAGDKNFIKKAKEKYDKQF